MRLGAIDPRIQEGAIQDVTMSDILGKCVVWKEDIIQGTKLANIGNACLGVPAWVVACSS